MYIYIVMDVDFAEDGREIKTICGIFNSQEKAEMEKKSYEEVDWRADIRVERHWVRMLKG